MRDPMTTGLVAALQPYQTQGERIKVVRGDVWVHFPEEPNESALLRVLASKRLGIGTMRNWNTVRRLNEMLESRIV